MRRVKSRRVLLSRARLDRTTYCWLYAELPGWGSALGKRGSGRFLLRVHSTGATPMRTTLTIANGDSTGLNAFCAGEGLSVYASHFKRHPGLDRETLLAAIEWARQTLVVMCKRDVLRHQTLATKDGGRLTIYFSGGYVKEVRYSDAHRRMWVAPDCSGTWETCLNDAHYMVRTLTDAPDVVRCVCEAISRQYVERVADVCQT